MSEPKTTTATCQTDSCTGCSCACHTDPQPAAPAGDIFTAQPDDLSSVSGNNETGSIKQPEPDLSSKPSESTGDAPDDYLREILRSVRDQEQTIHDAYAEIVTDVISEQTTKAYEADLREALDMWLDADRPYVMNVEKILGPFKRRITKLNSGDTPDHDS